MKNFFFNWLGRLLGFDSGSFTINHGIHELFIPTKIRPNSVWVRLHHHGHDGCCQIPLNEISYVLKHHGILFTLDIETEKCTVEWFAVS